MTAPLPYSRQCIDEEDIEAVVKCLRSDRITQGPLIEEFEQALCERTGARYAIAVSSGTAALHLAALTLGVKPDDYGIVPSITFVASANAILFAGGRVKFADVDPESGLMDVSDLEKGVGLLAKSGTPPKVIVPVDLCGQPAALPEVKRIAQKVGACVIEDAAHALGASYEHNGARYRAGCCEHSDAAILSFHPVKQITTGEGGALLTNEAALAARARELRSHGVHRDPARMELKNEGPWYYEQSELGFHYRITDIQCALGLSQLKKLDRFIQRRREIASHYEDAFSKSPLAERIVPLKNFAGTGHAWHLYVVRVRGSNKKIATLRKELYLFLREWQIHAQVHYVPVHWQPHYRRTQKTDIGECTGANDYYASCLSLPLFPAMSDADVSRVVEALRAWAERGEP